MNYTDILNYIVGLWPVAETVLEVLGGAVILGLTYVKLTPNVKDDAFIAKMESMPVIGKLLKAIKSFSPIERKKK